MSLTNAKPVAFLATTRPADATVFYRDVLGLRLVEETGFALVFDAFGTMLRVQKADEVQPPTYTAFGFEVKDLDACVTSLLAKGVTVLKPEGMELDPNGVWTAPNGTRVFWFYDPEGHVLSLSQ
jgi:catechol 2,3-dioxygenase-like lactoylglutathione lyase family enzyme